MSAGVPWLLQTSTRHKYLEIFGKIFGQGDEQKMKNSNPNRHTKESKK